MNVYKDLKVVVNVSDLSVDELIDALKTTYGFLMVKNSNTRRYIKNVPKLAVLYPTVTLIYLSIFYNLPDIVSELNWFVVWVLEFIKIILLILSLSAVVSWYTLDAKAHALASSVKKVDFIFRQLTKIEKAKGLSNYDYIVNDVKSTITQMNKSHSLTLFTRHQKG